MLIVSGALAGLVLLYVLFSFQFNDFFIDLWWFRSLSLESYFYMRLLYRYVIFSLVTLLFFLIFFFNFFVASRYLGSSYPSVNGTEAKTENKLIRMFRKGSLKIYTPLSLLATIPIALPFYEKWEKALLFIFRPSAGAPDPIYHNDISFYLFSYPFYKLIQNELLITFILLFTGLLILYFVERRVLKKDNKKLPMGARIHLTVLALLTVFIQCWGFWLNRYDLLYSASHQPLFFGPGFVEIRFMLPMIWASLITFIFTALSTIIYVHYRKGLKLLVFFGVLFLAATGLKNASIIPDMIQKYIVFPNEQVREKPYISYSIESTLAAYDLSNVVPKDFVFKQSHSLEIDEDLNHAIRNIPVWDKELLDSVYKQLQGIRSYYDFPSVDVDRYTVNGLYQQVYLAARELNLSNLPEYAAKNWINIRLQYTHGYGAVMTPAVQDGEEIMTWFLKDIPPKSNYGISVENPAIYYGLEDYEHIIVPNELGEIDYPEVGSNAITHYNGKGGVPIRSLLRKLLFATYFKEKNIFFTTKTNNDSKVLFRRNILESIPMITPFFNLDKDPYVVVTDKGIFWILDAYTTSSFYPNAEFSEGGYNYIRDSVKIVVDAYNGSVDYYIVNPKDPVVRAYDRIYPGLLKPISKMPDNLKAHLRYPRDVFETQMKIYTKYHQKEADIFYRQEDIWTLAQIPKEKEPESMKPYYITLNLINPLKHEFLLIAPMSPMGRDNLRSLVIAGCDGDNYGKLFIYSFPKGEQVYGPSQISTLIDQDTDITQQFTLWNQEGSQVRRGRMIVLPIKNQILYIQPVYLISSTRLKIPELQRIIVSQGDIVTMDTTIEGAFEKLDAKLKSKVERMKRRFSITGADEEEAMPSANDVKKETHENTGGDNDITTSHETKKE